jgi:predicted short-subunit dehydrogenase-like oxidoreductase (DUF2520 family)
MRVVIIGTGNVATVLGGKIVSAGHEMVQVAGRRAEAASLLAEEWGCDYTTRWSGIDQTADIYIVALSDSALEGLSRELALPGKLVVHTAGSVSASVLEPASTNCGVLYPLQTLSAAVRPFPDFPLLIDTLEKESLPIIETFARTLSKQVQHAGDTTRLKLHLAAILVNNFTNHLYTLASGYCSRQGIDFSLLLSLILETAERIKRYPPNELQTGPAVRGDGATIARHLEILDNFQDIKDIYKLFTIKIEEYYGVKEIPVP